MQSLSTLNTTSSSSSVVASTSGAMAHFFQDPLSLHYLYYFLDIKSKVALYMASSHFRRMWHRILLTSTACEKFELMIRLWCVNQWRLAYRLILGVELPSVEMNATLVQQDKIRVFSLPSKAFFRPTSKLDKLYQLKLFCDTCKIDKREDINVLEDALWNLIELCHKQVHTPLEEFMIANDFGFICEPNGSITWSAKAFKIIMPVISKSYREKMKSYPNVKVAEITEENMIKDNNLVLPSNSLEFLLWSTALSSYFYLNRLGFDSPLYISALLPLHKISTSSVKTIQQWYAAVVDRFLQYPQEVISSILESKGDSNPSHILNKLMNGTKLRDYSSLQSFFGNRMEVSALEIAKQVFEVFAYSNITESNLLNCTKIITEWLSRQCSTTTTATPQPVPLGHDIFNLMKIVTRPHKIENCVRLLRLVLDIVSLYDVTHNYYNKEAYTAFIDFLVFLFDSYDFIDRNLFQATLVKFKVVDFIKTAEELNKYFDVTIGDVTIEIMVRIITQDNPTCFDKSFGTFERLWLLCTTNRGQFASTLTFYMFHVRPMNFRDVMSYFRKLPEWIDAWMSNQPRYVFEKHDIQPNFDQRARYAQWCEMERQLYLSKSNTTKRKFNEIEDNAC